MSGEDPFFPDGGEGQPGGPAGTGFDAGSLPAVYSMPEPVAYGGGDGQFGTAIPPHPLDAMPGPSYQPRPTDPYTLEEAAGVIEMANNQFEAAIKERADREAAQAAEVKRRAEEELDGFYDDRTDEVAKRQARSREQEEAFFREVNASIEESASNPWSRVCELVDLKAPVLAATSSRGASGSRRASTVGEAIEGDDAYRATEKMRSLIIQMKADTVHDNTGDDAG